jgi:hypothetical protein
VQNVIHPEFLLIVLGTALLPEGRPRRFAGCAAVTVGLALAGAGAGPTEPPPALPPGFLAVEAGLFVIGAALGIGSALVVVRSSRTKASVAGSAAAAGGGLGAALIAGPYVVSAPIAWLVAAIVAIAGLGWMLAALGGRSRPAVVPVTGSAPRIGLAAIGAGALLAAAAWSAGGVFIGCLLAAIGGWMVCRVPRGRTWPVAPLLVLALLAPAWWLMATIAGPEGLAIGSLPDLPWSPAAERLLAPVLLLAAWAMSGLWPLHRQEPAVLTSPVAALLLLRIAIPAFADGLDHWRALAMPVVLVGLWHGVLTRRWQVSVAALAWIGLVTATPEGQVGGLLVLLAGLGLELAGRMPARARRGTPVLRAAAALLFAGGALLAIEGGLGTEVVYTVLAAAALVAWAAQPAAAQASTASDPIATAPSA